MMFKWNPKNLMQILRVYEQMIWFIISGSSVTRSVQHWRGTGAWLRPCRLTPLQTPSTFAPPPYTATASRRMPGFTPLIGFYHMLRSCWLDCLHRPLNHCTKSFHLSCAAGTETSKKTDELQCSSYTSLCFHSFRKDLKFVTEVEEEIKNLVELTNKVRW